MSTPPSNHKQALSYALSQIQSLKRSLLLCNESLTKQRIRSDQHQQLITKLNNLIKSKDEEIVLLVKDNKALREQQVSREKIGECMRESFKEVIEKIKGIQVLENLVQKYEEKQNQNDEIERISGLISKAIDKMKQQQSLSTLKVDTIIGNYKDVQEENQKIREELDRLKEQNEVRIGKMREEMRKGEEGILEEEYERLVNGRRFKGERREVEELMGIVGILKVTTEELLNYV